LDGTVTYAGYDGDYGYSVVVSHSNGMKTRYAHCNALCVSVGAKVSRGDMIATVGNTGWSTGNHLHFEIIINGNRVNPGPYIGFN
jgi:murein DD-endopeptidase MepM/ murein hydrolase activator NlpD